MERKTKKILNICPKSADVENTIAEQRLFLEESLKTSANVVSLMNSGARKRNLEYIIVLSDLQRQIGKELMRVADDLRLEKLKK